MNIGSFLWPKIKSNKLSKFQYFLTIVSNLKFLPFACFIKIRRWRWHLNSEKCVASSKRFSAAAICSYVTFYPYYLSPSLEPIPFVDRAIRFANQVSSVHDLQESMSISIDQDTRGEPSFAMRGGVRCGGGRGLGRKERSDLFPRYLHVGVRLPSTGYTSCTY